MLKPGAVPRCKERFVGPFACTAERLLVMVDEVFKNLVDQFSDPFTCLRELVQNSMDAGTEAIEVSTKYLPDPGGVCLEIQDYGAGMNRAIIDSKLTRLFSSDKENDLTKIGKFGIGFVSVFSLKPELVIVDTGRDGEYWRIAFDGGTDFQLFELHEPVEGTSVRIHKILPYEEYEDFCTRCQETLSRWCRHSDVSLSFNEDIINRDLVVESACRVDFKGGLGHFNLGVTSEPNPTFGLYNTGLTLTEGEHERWAGVTFKILSGHLEHTLTRDAVIVDDNYNKVMAKLDKLVSNDLFDSVCERLRDSNTQEAAAEQSVNYLRGITENLKRRQKKQPFLHDIFGEDVTWAQLEDCIDSEERLFWARQATPLVERAKREGIPVLACSQGSHMARLLNSVFQVPVVSLEENLAAGQEVARPPGFKALQSTLRSLLRAARITITSVIPVEYPGSTNSAEHPPCTFAMGVSRLVRRYRKGFWATKYLLPQQLLLNVDHPLVRKGLTRLEDPASRRVVAYALCKAALLNDGLAPTTESRLLHTLTDKSS